MAARSGMTALIARLRLMIDDPDVSTKLFTDDQLQQYLDTNRVRLAGNTLDYDVPLRLVFESPYPNLETTSELRDGSNAVISSGLYTANYESGSFTFTVSPTTYTPRLWGYAYDIHAAAAEAFTTKASRSSVWKGQFGLLSMQTINMHRRLSWGRSGDVTRV